MPNLDFKVRRVEAVARGMTPLLRFGVEITSNPDSQPIQALLLTAQIQFQCPLREYSAMEKEKLVDLFGAPERWGQTLRNRLWAHAQTTVGSFCGGTEAVLPVPCSYDLNVASSKYLYGLEGGEVCLLFLFSGSVFYSGPGDRWQVERISWNKECSYRFPVTLWQNLMEQHFPNSAWLPLRRDVFERVYEFKRRNGLATWEQALGLLLDQASSCDIAPEAKELSHSREVPA